MNKMKQKELRKARITLRKLYKRYGDELYKITNKIDKDLEKLEKGIGDKNE